MTQTMRIINEKPPVYDQIVAAGMKPSNKTIFTYGDAIYNPNNLDIPDYLVEHEKTHCFQQGNDPDAWWSRYIDDQNFRIEQESEAYAKQYAFMCQRIKDRNQRFQLAFGLGTILASPIYGKIISPMAAYAMIKEKAKVK